jgi:hypothetical protein
MPEVNVVAPAAGNSVDRLVLSATDARTGDATARPENYYCGCCCSCMAEE